MPSVLPSSTTRISRSTRELDRAHAAHDLDHGVALVVDRHDHRELPELVPRAFSSCHALAPPVPVVRAGETFAELDRRLPAEELPASEMSGRRCVGVVGGQRLEHEVDASTPVTSSTSSASSSIVNSSGLPMFIGLDVVGVEQREQPGDLVVDVAERPRLLAVAVDRERLAPHRLREEVRHHPPVGRPQAAGRRC